MSPKKWRQVEKWVAEVQKHLSEGTLTSETASVISKEYKVGDEPPPKGSVRSTIETETSSMTVHGCQPVPRPSSAFSSTPTQRPRSSMTSRSSSRLETTPSVAVVRPSPARTPVSSDKGRLNTTKDTGSSTNVNRSRRCCCCCSTTGSMGANGSSPGGWVSPSVANTLQANRNRAAYNQPIKNSESSPQDSRTYRLMYQHVPNYGKPDAESYAPPNGYPPWVTGASVVISANQIRSSPHVTYKPPSMLLNKTDNKWNGNRWKSDSTASKMVTVDPVPVH